MGIICNLHYLFVAQIQSKSYLQVTMRKAYK